MQVKAVWCEIQKLLTHSQSKKLHSVCKAWNVLGQQSTFFLLKWWFNKLDFICRIPLFHLPVLENDYAQEHLDQWIVPYMSELELAMHQEPQIIEFQGSTTTVPNQLFFVALWFYKKDAVWLDLSFCEGSKSELCIQTCRDYPHYNKERLSLVPKFVLDAFKKDAISAQTAADICKWWVQEHGTIQVQVAGCKGNELREAWNRVTSLSNGILTLHYRNKKSDKKTIDIWFACGMSYFPILRTMNFEKRNIWHVID